MIHSLGAAHKDRPTFYRMKRTLLSLLLLLLCFAAVYAAGPGDIIPLPAEYTLQGGFHKGGKEHVRFVRNMPAEGYRLRIRRNCIRIEAADEAGLFYARATLAQLRDGTPVPCCTIKDYPRYRHRGLMIDESRSFKGKEFLFKQMDAMARLKLNVLHLHLDDSAGWRIESEEFPLLTARTAWRIGTTYHQWEGGGYKFSTEGDPDAYGGYYSKADLQEIVAYAADRHITVIPEIEMPGHSLEVGYAYPECLCLLADGRRITGNWDLCPGSEFTFRLLEGVLSEIMDIFPSPYIHIGGDEAYMKNWERCVNCQARMKEEGITDYRRLQGYLVRRIEEFVRSRGRQVICWDEILESGVPEGAVVQSWRGVDGGRKASAAGHDVVMSPTSHCYLDYYQDLIRKEPRAVGELNSLRHCYGFNPSDGIGIQEHVLGLQGNLWCELIPTPEHAEYMLYPRLFAIAETGWTPQERKEYYGFRVRARRLLDVFEALGYNHFDMDAESPRAQSKAFEKGTRLGYNIVYQEDGPTLSYGWDSGVRIIVADEQAFRDMNGNQALDPFEDWRLPASTRTEDLKARLAAGEKIYTFSAGMSPEEFIAKAENPYNAL